MKLKLTWLMTLFMAFVMQFSFAQEKTVSGTVTSLSDGFPLPGVSIIVKGTTRGVQTDFDGNYSISVRAGETLAFSFVSMKSTEVVVGASNTYNVTMEEDIAALDEVIIVGYGTTTKDAFTGTATKISSENIEAKTVSNISQALKGEVAGVNVITGSGAPGSNATIRIRGFGSVNGNQNPLYVVDGAPFQSDISAINVADIESTTVLKDAAATSIYGSRGANGVILITTKQGKSNTSVISVDFQTSINTHILPNYSVVNSPEEYMELAWMSLRNKGALLGQANPAAWASANIYGTVEGINNHYNIWDAPGASLIDPATGKFNQGVNRRYTPKRWDDEAFGTGYRQEANVQFSGGNEKTRFSTSFGYVDDQGYTVNSRYTRYSTRLNLDHKAKDWLSIGGNMAFTGARYNNSSSSEGDAGSSGNIFALTNTTPAIYDVFLRDANGNRVEDPIFGGFQYDYGGSFGRRAWNSTNGIADAKYDVQRTDVNTLLGNFNVGVDFTDYLKLELRYSGQYNFSDDASRANPYYGGAKGSGGTLFKTKDLNVNQNFLQLLRFNKTFGEHSLEAFVAHESTENKFQRMSAGAQKAILPNTFDLSQYTTPFGKANSYTQGWTLDSYFSQLNYSFAHKYFVTASVRRDGSSRFLKDKWGTFGSAGLGWVVSKENFFSNVSFMDYFKLKASYGVIGDQGTNLLYGWQLYNINDTADGSYSFTQGATRANPDLTWETSKIAQVGFESTWFDDRFNLDVDYYVKNTTNLFFNQSLPGSNGFANIQYNDGTLRNSGLEFNALVKVVKDGDFRLSVGVNGEIFDNEITEMPNDFLTGEPKVLDGSYSKGKSMYDWYMREWAGVDPGNGAALWNMYFNDVNNDGIFNAGDERISSMTRYMHDNPDANVQSTTTSVYANATTKYSGKSAIPKVRGGFRLSTGYKGFDLSAQFSYSLGGYVYDGGYSVLMYNRSLIGNDNWHTDMRNAWKEPGDITNVPRMSAAFADDVSFQNQSTRFLTKADYLSLNNVNLGYTLPKQYAEDMNLTRVKFFVSGDNLLMFSKRDGLNPSTMISSGNSGIYMPMTTFSLGAKIEF
ncbi:SusC/RagA family TonB-linked outer membrane protein [Gelidibacter gilvus]|uniref:SusC/RagA family TonB-linked outer membrane protein n=1 Tax=Gelidibacter gilvus TaxID=59602 RepID=A0A4V1LMH5_9FLAO|nr:SusC/RagA family TonB-linked outer membrane protein [Gelidibacter gilvus]RXJ44579.1 SusC/RagA family TonB-linked outer membrane protein [Gelidibacter gilvus]